MSKYPLYSEQTLDGPSKLQKSTENSLSKGKEAATSIPPAQHPHLQSSLASVLTNCRAASQLLHIHSSTPTAAIDESLKVFLHEMEKDISHASQFLSSEKPMTSGSAEQCAAASPANHASLLANCRSAIQLHQIRMLTPTPAISSSLQMLLNDMEKDLTCRSQLALNSILGTRNDAQTSAKANAAVAERAWVWSNSTEQ